MLTALWNLSTAIRGYLRFYMPTNRAVDWLRTPRGLKWAIPVALVETPAYLGLTAVAIHFAARPGHEVKAGTPARIVLGAPIIGTLSNTNNAVPADPRPLQRMGRNMVSNSNLTPEEHAKGLRDLKKVQQRTAAIILVSVIYPCAFTLIGAGKIIFDQDRTADAILLVVLGFVLGIAQTLITRVILGHRPFSLFWTVATVVPLVIFTIWYF